ncbi:MAG: ThuA domain-containing protein [Bacteroidales bacterium]|jgi:type 1 glutamine amidotransferase|nr:ThuA domain-containing protein [Bacteroidales bacterium]
MKHLFRISALLTVSLLLSGGAISAKKPVRALIITGQNNHNWPVSNVVLKQTLESSGLFQASVIVSPSKGKDMSGFNPDFGSCDVVVLDYNGDPWPEAVRQQFVQFVRKGGGVVVYHAADNAFADWKEFNEMCALGGWEGRNEKSGPYVYWKDGALVRDTSPGSGGSHGAQHEYVLTARTPNHPITKGLPVQWKHGRDELYDRMRGPGNIDALLYTAYADPDKHGSGREEPLMFTVRFGRGRIFHTMLGHAGSTADDNPSMQCAGFQVLLLRGTEWAATGKVTQPVPADFPTAQQTSTRANYQSKD